MENNFLKVTYKVVCAPPPSLSLSLSPIGLKVI